MKKVLSVLLAGLLAVSLAGCGKGEESSLAISSEEVSVEDVVSEEASEEVASIEEVPSEAPASQQAAASSKAATPSSSKAPVAPSSQTTVTPPASSTAPTPNPPATPPSWYGELVTYVNASSYYTSISYEGTQKTPDGFQGHKIILKTYHGMFVDLYGDVQNPSNPSGKFRLWYRGSEKSEQLFWAQAVDITQTKEFLAIFSTSMFP